MGYKIDLTLPGEDDQKFEADELFCVNDGSYGPPKNFAIEGETGKITLLVNLAKVTTVQVEVID